MDQTTIAAIRTELVGIRNWTLTLDVLTNIYQKGEVSLVASEKLPLTATQRNGIKSRATTIANGLETHLNALPGLTGKVGVPNTDQVLSTPAPQALETCSQLYQNLASTIERPEIQPDGSLAVTFTDAEAQELADLLATIRDMVINLINMLRTRLV